MKTAVRALIASIVVCCVVFCMASCSSVTDPDPIPIPPPEWSDDFDDGDFTATPAWAEINDDDAPGIVEVTGDDRYVRFFRDAPSGNGGNISLVHDFCYNVTDSTAVEFDVNPVYAEICGWEGAEHPVEVTLHLRDDAGTDLYLRFCYNHVGGWSLYEQHYIRIVFPDCEQNVWLRGERFVVRDYFPQAASLVGIELAGRGWDFEGYIDNVLLTGLEDACAAQ